MEPIFPNTQPYASSDNRHDRNNTRSTSTHAFTDRVYRALRHPLMLLYRNDPSFYVLGATGNVYVVNICSNVMCSCPDRTTPCKHILFVLIKVLGVSLDDSCLRRQRLRPCHLTRLLASPTSPDSLAGPSLRERFHQAFLLQREIGRPCLNLCPDVEEGTTCPICLEEIGKVAGERVVSCGTCKNPLHEECLLTWKRSQRRRSVSCVICRSRWRNKSEQERYLNLSAYIREDEHLVPQCGERTACSE